MAKPLLLIVDDIFVNRMLLSEIAKDIGCEYKVASNGKEAIEKLAEFNFDMVLMDIEMPVMNGLETTRYIRTKFDDKSSKIPIIALTAHNPNDFFDEFNSAGFDELLTKPYMLSKIKEVVERFCKKLV
ncbi:MAG: response regulator [Salinivirgaceae bacterium]|nr:response regulator [Salinivirgaceae bacterium]